MEAPAKTGGTRKSRPRRDLIGRLSTLPPIEFLKKHNPLRRRRRRPQLGFDQPPAEIRRLALPLRPAPPSLSMRLYVRVREIGEWMAGRLTTAGKAARQVMRAAILRATAIAGRTWELVRPAFVRVASAANGVFRALARSRLVRWLEHQASMVSARLSALAPADWEPGQTTALLARTQRVRRTLVGLVVCEWTALLGLLIVLGILAVAGRGWDRMSINAYGLILSAISLTALGMQAWHQRLVEAWRGMELFICGSCGELRNFSPSLACPECGTADTPVFPGQTPEAWARGRTLISPLAAAGPALLASMLLLAAKVV